MGPPAAGPVGKQALGTHEDTSMTTPGGSTDLCYQLNDHDEIVFVNESWDAFARASDSEDLVAPHVLGRRLWGFITDATTRQIYLDVLKRVRSGSRVRFQFRCDTPSRRRLLEMDVSQVAGTIEFRSRVIWEEEREYQVLLEPDRPASNEFLHVCAWCKKVDIGAAWVEVEDAVSALRLFERPLLPQLTHGICQACYRDMMEIIEEHDASASAVADRQSA